MKRAAKLVLFLAIAFGMQGAGFCQDISFSKGVMSQAEVVDLTVKITGLKFFVSKGMQNEGDRMFEFEKKIASMHYPVLKKARRDRAADCCFVSKVAYQILSPQKKRERISCEGAINSLQTKGYPVTCKPGQIVDKADVLNLFRDPKFLKDVMEKVDTVKSSPYSTRLSESYSTPASRAK